MVRPVLLSPSVRGCPTTLSGAGFLLGTRQTLLETFDAGKTWEARNIEAAKDEVGRSDGRGKGQDLENRYEVAAS